METNEISIIERCQAGDLASFGKLYDQYVRRIYDFVYYKTLHKETAEDLTSQAFLKALKNINRFNITEGGTFQAWLYQIARNTVIDHYRTSKADVSIEDAWSIGSEQDIGYDIDLNVKLKSVEKYLQNLSASQREIVMLRVWGEMSYKEISEVTKLSEANCKMTFSRVIKKLRESELGAELLLLFIILFVR